MQKETKIFINDLTQVILEENNISIPIKDMREVVKKLGGYVHSKNAFIEEDQLPGTVKKVDENSFAIKIDRFFFEEEREKFAIASELGHIYLHMGYHYLPEVWREHEDDVYFLFDEDDHKYQANYFASAFLMPEDIYKEKIEENTDENGRIDIKNVANYFNVSVPAATNRGKRLGLIEW